MNTFKQLLPVAFISFTLSLSITSCGNEEEVVYDETQDDFISEVDYDEFTKELVALETKILSQTPAPENLLKEATTKFQDFAGYFPEDPKAPEYLLKASDFALTLGQVEKSIKILDRIIKEYPDFNQMESVVYNKADHLDFNLRDTTAAKMAYQEFIDKYPQSDLVDDAQSRIRNISLSAEELADKYIQELEKNPH